MAYQCNVCRTSSTNDPIALHPYDLHMINTFSPQCAHHYTNFELKYPTIIQKREAIQCPQVQDTCGTKFVPQHIQMQAPIQESYRKPATVQYYTAPSYAGPRVQRFTQNIQDQISKNVSQGVDKVMGTSTPQSAPQSAPQSTPPVAQSAQEKPTLTSLIDKYVQAIGNDIRAMIRV